MKKPNILFILVDQMRADALGCSGHWARTPNLDSIAAEGVRFTTCVTNSPVCQPARVSLATGLYPHNTGLWGNDGAYTMPTDSRTWMQAIRSAGYRTSLFGKTHLYGHGPDVDMRRMEHLLHAYGIDDVHEIPGPAASRWCRSYMMGCWEEHGLLDAYRADHDNRFSCMRGDDDVDLVRPSSLPLEYYYDTYVARHAREYLDAYDREEPWCCWVSFGGPHEPWDTPEPYASMHRPEDMPSAAPGSGRPDGCPQGSLYDKLDGKHRRLSPQDIGKLRANYAGNVALIDEQIGTLLESIQRRGELDNTVIAFTSDHGELNGDYGLTFKSVFLNGATRVPLLVRTPQTVAAAGAPRVWDGPVELMDIGATLAEYAGRTLDYPQFGRSLAGVVSGKSQEHRRSALCEIHDEVMLQTERWKFALNRQGEPYLLFDVAGDPQESHNLVSDPDCAGVVTELHGLCRQRVGLSQAPGNPTTGSM
jgi:arylsulfatase A-like enzyme